MYNNILEPEKSGCLEKAETSYTFDKFLLAVWSDDVEIHHLETHV